MGVHGKQAPSPSQNLANLATPLRISLRYQQLQSTKKHTASMSVSSCKHCRDVRGSKVILHAPE